MFLKVVRRLVRPPSHATVVAYLALFFAMGGTAYAAAKWTSADIVDGTLTGADISDNSLTGADITSGSISSSDLAPGTLDSGGSSSVGTLLGAVSNPDPVTGPMYGTDAAVETVPVTSSITFTVPEGKRYQVFVSANTEMAAEYGSCGWLESTPGETTHFGGAGVALDEELHDPPWVVAGNGSMIIDAGTHTLRYVIAPNACVAPDFTPGSFSVSTPTCPSTCWRSSRHPARTDSQRCES